MTTTSIIAKRTKPRAALPELKAGGADAYYRARLLVIEAHQKFAEVIATFEEAGKLVMSPAETWPDCEFRSRVYDVESELDMCVHSMEESLVQVSADYAAHLARKENDHSPPRKALGPAVMMAETLQGFAHRCRRSGLGNVTSYSLEMVAIPDQLEEAAVLLERLCESKDSSAIADGICNERMDKAKEKLTRDVATWSKITEGRAAEWFMRLPSQAEQRQFIRLAESLNIQRQEEESTAYTADGYELKLTGIAGDGVEAESAAAEKGIIDGLVDGAVAAAVSGLVEDDSGKDGAA